MSRSLRVTRIATNQPNKFIDVSVGHDAQRKQYTLNLNVIEIDDPDGMFKKWMVGMGAWGCLEQTPRFNAKRLEHWRNTALATELYDRCLHNVLYKNEGLEVPQAEPAAV